MTDGEPGDSSASEPRAQAASPPAPPPESPFRRLRFGRLVLWPILGTVVVLVVVLMLPHASFGEGTIAFFYVAYGLLLLAALSACRRAGVPVAAVMGTPPEDRRPWFTAGLLGPLALAFSAVSLWATVTLASHFIPGWASNQVSGQAGPEGFLDALNTTHRLLLALNVTLLAPVAEEFVFRGMLMRRWIASRGFWPGIVGSAVVFSLLHPPNWLGSFAFGIVAGVLYLWSGSLLLPIVAHVINNLFVTLTILAGEIAPSEPEPVPTIDELQAQWLMPVVMLLLAAAVVAAVVRPLVPGARARAEII